MQLHDLSAHTLANLLMRRRFLKGLLMQLKTLFLLFQDRWQTCLPCTLVLQT